jgi:hypothetical protein
MKKNKSFPVVFLLMAAIIGFRLFKDYIPETGEFKNNGLAIIYAITFTLCIILSIRILFFGKKQG